MSIMHRLPLIASAGARIAPTSGRIISDGCRDYLVGVSHAQRTDILMDRRGNPLRFPSLAQAKAALRRQNVADIRLSVRVAADEACAGACLQDSGFADVNVERASPAVR